VRAKLALYGAQVINIDMRNFSFAKEYMAAINAKTTQDQLLQAAEKKAQDRGCGAKAEGRHCRSRSHATEGQG
jgi:hypothetical protein